MRVTTKITWDLDGNVVEHEWFEYDGPVAQLKKGRQQATAASNASNMTGSMLQTEGVKAAGLQDNYRTGMNRGANTYLGAPTGPNGLSRWTNSQYQNDIRQNNMNAKDDIAVGERMLARRGFNSSPGALSSLINTENRNKDAANTQAYNTAVNRQLGLGLQGIDLNQRNMMFFDPTSRYNAATNAFGTAANAAAARSQMGSKVGDIMGGLSGIMGIASGGMGLYNAANNLPGVNLG